MKKARRTFTTEFKQEAASLVLEQGSRIREACQAMGVGETAMRRWVKQLKAERGGETPIGSKALTAEQQRYKNYKHRISDWSGRKKY